MPEDFHFAPPPEQIGRVLAASTTLRKNRVWLKHFSSLGIPFQHALGYLGESGVACFECDRNPGRLIRREVLVFAEASNLFRRRSDAGVFEFLWKDPLDRLLFRFDDQKLFDLLKAAEEAWTKLVLNAASDTLDRGGSIDFLVLGQGVLRLGPTSLSWGNLILKPTDFKFFCRDHFGFELHPSYAGEAKGFVPLKARAEAVANLEALTQLLIHVFGLQLTDFPTEQRKASS